MTAATKETAALREGREALGRLRKQQEDLRAKHDELTKERREVFAALQPVEIVVENMRRLVDREGEAWVEDMGSTFARSCSGHKKVMADLATFVDVAPSLPVGRAEELTLRDLCGIAPDLVKARLETVIRSAKVRFGLAPAPREAKLAAIDRELAEVESAHTAVVDSASEFEISLPLLPAVAAARSIEKRRLEIQAENAEMAKEGRFPVSVGVGGRA